MIWNGAHSTAILFSDPCFSSGWLLKLSCSLMAGGPKTQTQKKKKDLTAVLYYEAKSSHIHVFVSNVDLNGKLSFHSSCYSYVGVIV